MKWSSPVPENLNDAVALSLVELRVKEGYTQGAAAKFMGFSQAQLSRIESGECAITLKQLETFSSVYGVSPIAVVKSAIAKLRGVR